ncbi:unnamed protein product [Penicillium nalgiovense]|nr:unnamed protein product [Penicillium nalgiovense]
MQSGRSSFRNVHFYDASNGQLLGGLYQAGSVTESNLIWILGSVLFVGTERFTTTFTIRHRESGRDMTPSNDPVMPGHYDIVSDGNSRTSFSIGMFMLTYQLGTIAVTEEPWFARLGSHSVSGREESFRKCVRQRDRKCVISGIINELAGVDWWAGFQAAHVFPLEKESLWIEHGYGRYITNMDDTPRTSKINTVQNGLLMNAALHICFGQYMFSVNPDDGYKIVTFVPDQWQIDGRVLDPVCRQPNDPNHVADDLLRWHFRQSVLANMRGAGEPVFETDFPPGTDKMTTLRNEQYGKERFEMELELRLRPMAKEET